MFLEKDNCASKKELILKVILKKIPRSILGLRF
jgi:hypothetical protein